MFPKLAMIGSVAVCLLPLRLAGQEKPLSVNAVFSTGYYDTYTRDTADHSVSFVPFGAKFDISGYWMMPDFLSFTAQPELNAGPQASDAGFLGGNGIRLNVTLLRKRIFPLTFHYTNVQMENVSFGGIWQYSAYSLKDRNTDLGLTWQLKPRTGLPELLIDWSRTSVHSTSDSVFIPDNQTSGSHVNADSKLERWGWNLAGQVHDQQFQTDLFAPLGVGANTASLGQTLFQYQGSAERTFWNGSDLLVSGGSQSSSSILFNQPLDLSAHFANANLRLAPSKRWKNYLRASYTSNLTSALVNQVVSGLGAGGPGTIAPDPSLFSTLQGRISDVVLSATSNFEVGKGVGLYGSVDDGQVSSSNPQTSSQNARFFTASAGATYSKKLPWGHVSGQYGRELGYGSAIGQTGTIRGQTYSVTFEAGSIDRLQADVSVHGNTQSVQNNLPFNGRTFSADATIGRRVFAQFSVRLGGGWQTGVSTNAGTEFDSHGFTARASLEHPRVQISASINQTLANSLPIYNQLVGIDPVVGLLLSPLSIIPSDYRGMSFTFHALPLRKVEISATWSQSQQHLAGILNNDFSLLDARATYHFRKLQFDAGYIRAIQTFIDYPTTKRGRFYVRVARPAKLL